MRNHTNCRAPTVMYLPKIGEKPQINTILCSNTKWRFSLNGIGSANIHLVWERLTVNN